MTKGFSLVELSIVLVILGLLTGGILAGQSLIRAAELRSVSTEYGRFQTAVHTFQDKYFAIPGDFDIAHRFWDPAGGSGVVGDGCEAATGSGTETCSGDGDGMLDKPGGVSEYGETFTFWQHLNNAGLLEGSYTGITGAGGITDHILGENSPMSKLSNAVWAIGYWDNSTGTGTWNFSLDYGNFFAVGAMTSTAEGDVPVGLGFKTEEAWILIRKWMTACQDREK